ncbi:MAG: undecaprenyldiphospho-muramoylpentapeptide beta-N-acetylglucosaminyltransferase [Parvibaculaceae bacterium]
MALDLRMARRGTVVLAAGGTGGHLFPAQALGEELVKRGYVVHLMSDERARAMGNRFPAAQMHEVPSATLTLRRPWKLPGQALRLMKGLKAAQALLAQIAPSAIVGFGGYPSVPPLLAAARMKLPICLHEQNAVMGRANRLLARRATLIASSFPEIANLAPALKARVAMTGNPVREDVLRAADRPYEAPATDGEFRLLVFGGSQGAQFFSRLMPDVLKEMTSPVRRSLVLVQQCRPEDLDGMRRACDALGVRAELQPFFSDLPRRIAESHLVVCRSGATSVAELSVIGRPAILVPLPHSIDNDQLRNAEAFARAGAGWLMRQEEFGPSDLAAVVTRLRYNRSELGRAAAAARARAVPDAAVRLCDRLEVIMDGAASDTSISFGAERT